MKKSLVLLQHGFESSSQTTPEYSVFYNIFKKEFTVELKSIGATNISFSKGHFYISGFFKVKEQTYYFSISDIRGSDYLLNSGRPIQLLYRTAENEKDFRGGSNCYVSIETGMAKKMNIA